MSLPVSTVIHLLQYIDELDLQLRCILDAHAPVTHCKGIGRQTSPCYSSFTPELHSLREERQWVERHWLASGLTVHKQIMNFVKHKITKVVRDREH